MASPSLPSAFFVIHSFLIPLVDDRVWASDSVNNVNHEGKSEQTDVACEKLNKR